MKSDEVVRDTSATHRQLQWWDEMGFIVPKRKRHVRIYSDYQVAEIKAYLILRGKGMSPRACKLALKSIRSSSTRSRDFLKPRRGFFLIHRLGALISFEEDPNKAMEFLAVVNMPYFVLQVPCL